MLITLPLQKCHEEVVVKLLKLFAILLELPDEDQLVREHRYDVKGEDHRKQLLDTILIPLKSQKIQFSVRKEDFRGHINV